jgi:uncharacterized protein (DUF2062 family)/SAM-dependent methyltransferase
VRVTASSTIARRLFRDLRTEGSGRVREAVALGMGAFIGCLPFYGFHLLLVAAVGWLLRLNRLRMYVAANISNPLFAPVLIVTEIELGAWLRRGDLHHLTVDAIRNTDPWMFGADLLLGSVVVGLVAGMAIMMGTLAAVANAPLLPAHIETIFTRAADRYFERSLTAWEFARGKLRRDPIYRALLESTLPDGGTLVDVGCGQGLMLATFAEARLLAQAQRWPATTPPPVFERCVGIESRARVASLAARVLTGEAEIIHACAPGGLPHTVRVVFLVDVLHLMRGSDQERLLHAIAARLEPGGVLFVREADAAGGWRFRAVQFGNRLKNLAVGNWRQTFHFRTLDDWQQLFARSGWQAVPQPMGHGTPFANVLFRLTRLNEIADSHYEAEQVRGR